MLPTTPPIFCFPLSLPPLPPLAPLFLVPQQLQCPTDRGLNDEQAQLQHRQQAESAADQVGSKEQRVEGRKRRSGGVVRAATTTRTTRSNIDSNKNNSCLPFVSEFHSLLPLLPLSSGSCTASTRLLLLPLLCLLSPSVLYFTCCRTKKIQLKRNNIALHHQSSCPVRPSGSSCSSLLFLFRLRLTPSSTVAHQHAPLVSGSS